MTVTSAPTRWTLADGRELLLFDLPGHRSVPVPDRRSLPERRDTQSELRFDRTTGEWVIIAALRQDRTYKPPPDQCPLCPGPTGLTSEIPAPDYDVAVFENRFASLSGADGRCEVVCFSSDHTGSFADLDHPQARLVVEAWRHRTRDLLARTGIEQVFCFENRGEEIGVTLTHPHGQIYGYPYLTPHTEATLRQADAHRATHGTNLFADILDHEASSGARIITRAEHFTAFVPYAARWPVEVHIYPNRPVRNLLDLDGAELDGFTDIYRTTLQLLDRLYPEPLPYMAALHQYTDTDAQREGRFHAQIISTRRTATKLKYLASSESVMGAFINDVTPESLAETLRTLGEAR
ncbi:UDPglucose--hexose-1-phosphate uridylyltransferase [Mycolicibacterium rutilum]|uniref:Galactose-1-phosphate uridylyltransferase n=1 Tax=Mycolicibacterium rutilum TaxID=370526 RepID=A0A1H6M0W8_MYCRU|nr:galactose-1-phosphate uridylyltransferase [Mycolicibacterium rutilum]SEH91545.1 UDPglucose--hexose-1-phosphate uridylyltransferase [Mycolicibacterium rutilum]